MSIDFVLLKKVDKKHQLTVSGYFRNLQSILSDRDEDNAYFSAPDLIILLALSYYAIVEYFSIYNDETTILTEDNTCITYKECEFAWGNTAWGNVEVDPSKHAGIYKWFLKIEVMDLSGMIGIGSQFDHINAYINKRQN